MKPMIICLACCFLCLQNIKSQDSLKTGESKRHPLPTTISFSENQSMRVPLMAIRDSSIFVYEKTSANKNHKTDMYNESSWNSYNYTFIQSIKVRNTKIRAWLMPVAIVGGAIAGALIGNANAHNTEGLPGWGNEMGAIFLGGVLGAGVGAITGSLICNASDKKYMINGEWKSFEEMKKSMNY